MTDIVQSSSTYSPHVMGKWKGIFVESLYKVCQDVHPGTGIDKDALDHTEELLVRLLSDIIASGPVTIQDVERKVEASFPAPMNNWPLADAREALLAKKSLFRTHADKLLLPLTHKMHPILKDSLGYKIEERLTQFVCAVLLYIASDVLKLTGNYVKNIPNIRNSQITLQDLKIALRADRVLMEMFYAGVDDEATGYSFLVDEEAVNMKAQDQESTYEKIARDMLHYENNYLRELNLLVQVFRRAFEEALPRDSEDLDAVFSNILEIHELTVKCVRMLENCVEISETASVGSALLELCEGNEFDVYIKYVQDVLKPLCLETIYTLLEEPNVRKRIEGRGREFYLAVKYVLPKLLQGPVLHCFGYIENLEVLQRKAEDDYDRMDLINCQSLLVTLKSSLETLCGPQIKKSLSSQLGGHGRSAMGPQGTQLKQMQTIQKNIDGWEGKDIGYSCTEFIREGMVGKVKYRASSKIGLGATDTLRAKNKSCTERYVYLFDNLIVLCKPSNRKTPGVPEYNFKETLVVRNVDVFDREDIEELKHAFEIRRRSTNEPPFVLFARNAEEKQSWMAYLVMLMCRNTLDRMLDSFLKDQEKRIPLVLPSPKAYRFAEPDSDENIVFEDYTSSSGIPVVKGGTILKLVERLTYHLYSDSKFIRTFLTTYRSFCSPKDLLDLLLERFKIPQPSLDDETPLSPRNGPLSPNESSFSPSDWEQRIQRFRKDYQNPMQTRVLSIIRLWVVRHWYDFEQSNELLSNLWTFLNTIHSNMLKKWVDSIKKIVIRQEKKSKDEDDDGMLERKEIFFERHIPPTVWHLAEPGNEEQYDLFTLHPLEIGRQVTLLESDLYRAVKPFELVGAAWTKKDKDTRSPQLLKLTKHSNMITFWLELCIVSTRNLEERVALLSRMLEIMAVFEELNNFNGLMEVYSALNSAAVYRLHWTWTRLDREKREAYQRFKDLIGGGHGIAVKERLKHINPPCVPFFGHYLSTIFFLDEGNPTYFKDPDELSEATDHEAAGAQRIISFYKCRKIFQVIQDIQMYQNLPYSLAQEDSIRHFFESLNPLRDYDNDKNKLEQYLYEQSLEIEPKDCDRLPNFPAIRNSAQLKSPGLKPTNSKAHQMRMPRLGHPSSHKESLASLSQQDDDARLRASPREACGTSNFAMVDIRPGHAPRYVRDVPEVAHERRYVSSPQPHDRAVSPLTPNSPRAPPLPPRAVKQGTPSPRSPLSPLQQQSQNSSRPASPPTFVFPPTANGLKQSRPSQEGLAPAPALPPRKPTTPPRHQPLPPPLSPTTVQEAVREWNFSASSSRSVSPMQSATPPCQGNQSAPPLPPRRQQTLPPPRPPKRHQIVAESPIPQAVVTPPPLPPKTYKQKRQNTLR